MSELGTRLPKIVATPPGPRAQEWVDRLAHVECPAITARRSRRKAERGGTDPIVWAEARGANVRDVDGNVYVDLSAGFAVSAVGHAHPKVVEAAERQLQKLVHGMGDLFPSTEKIELGERLAALAPGDLRQSIFGLSGASAVEAAIKTAMVATGRSRVLGFHGGYHGMFLGALGVTGYRDQFRAPFSAWTRQETRLPYANCRDCMFGLEPGGCGLACADFVERMLRSEVAGTEDVAALIVEPIQGRGGDVVPPDGWLTRIREVTRDAGVLLVLDEIYTGFGRTGSWFACDHEGVVPDILVVGKAMGGGFPISAALGTSAVMDAWGESAGEAIHTHTFLGNPLGCAMALATIDVLESEALVARSRELGARWAAKLAAAISGVPRAGAVQGRGMMIGIPLLDADGAPWAGGAVTAMQALLERGFITSPGGPNGDVISLSPPLVATEEQLDAGTAAIAEWLHSLT